MSSANMKTSANHIDPRADGGALGKIVSTTTPTELRLSGAEANWAWLMTQEDSDKTTVEDIELMLMTEKDYARWNKTLNPTH